jgi:hypothetical protein
MGGELHFAKNFRDQSQQQGTGAGFQFDFYCEDCNDTWRSPFEPYRSAQAAGWLQRLSGVAGNLLGSVGSTLDDAADGYARAGWGTARDEALRDAIGKAKDHFHRCARCSSYVCDKCWNIDQGLCHRCAPSVEAEVAEARHGGMVEKAREDARAQGMENAAKVDVKSQKQLACPSCGAATGGGKFCPECGTSLNQVRTCAGCQHDVPPGSKFCPECGKAA